MKLDELQRDILLPQIDAFLAAAPDAAARDQYRALRAAIADLEVSDALGDRLGAIAEVLLSSGRVRDAHGPGAERALWTLFQATPRGRGILASVASVNAALKRMEGQALEFVSAVARGPGVYSLTLKNAQMQLVIRFEPAGVRVESAEL
ncbi:MAG: hypothetical protein ACRETH_08925 [Steroidobacteraceae bacterium]